MEVLQNTKAKLTVWGTVSISQARICQCIILALQLPAPGPIAFYCSLHYSQSNSLLRHTEKGASSGSCSPFTRSAAQTDSPSRVTLLWGNKWCCKILLLKKKKKRKMGTGTIQVFCLCKREVEVYLENILIFEELLWDAGSQKSFHFSLS